ncbi:MAG: histidine kinase dimerization/phospho-acceptor domain-containing protein [Croceibacterium sp.]
MQFDDRLATVLRTGARSATALRTQYRQLLDLLGSLPEGAAGELVDAGYARLAELAEELPAAEQSQILRAPGLRLRNRVLVAWLAHSEPQAAAAAMATARLSERDWLRLIPLVPVSARGFLRHRRDLPLAARQVLERLGDKDLVLPEPSLPTSPPDAESPAETGIGALVRRIEAFQRARREGAAPPGRAPEPGAEPAAGGNLAAFDFATDALGVVVWADAAAAPLMVGMTLGGDSRAALARLDPLAEAARSRRLPIRGGRVWLIGAPALAGEWYIDATPLFALAGGAFQGHAGRLRRVQETPAALSLPDTPADRMRQVLHELRTPVNAVQGFAEIIQQQLFGPVPHEYRALAAGIAVDAARLMAGFDELDRLARLESGAAEPSEGTSDLREVVAQLLRRLDGVLRPRSARMTLTASEGPFTVGLAEDEAGAFAWRLLATLAGAMSAGEVLEIALSGDGQRVTLRAELPAALADESDLFAATPPVAARAISAGMFGSGFAFRLARAEAAAAGGTLVRQEDSLIVELPAMTALAAPHALDDQG